MFDSIDLVEAISDIYDVGMKDDNLVLVYKAYKEIHMAVKTSNGLTERQTLETLGAPFSPLCRWTALERNVLRQAMAISTKIHYVTPCWGW